MKTAIFLFALSFVLRLNTNAQVIDFRKLELSLPQDTLVDNYRRSKPTGETASMMGFSTSWAQVRYGVNADSSNSHISFRISDMINLPSFLILALTGNVDKKTKTGYERTVEYRSLRLLETYDSLSKSAKLEMPIAGRFLVQITGDGVSDIKTLYHFLEIADIDRLERLALGLDKDKTK